MPGTSDLKAAAAAAAGLRVSDEDSAWVDALEQAASVARRRQAQQKRSDHHHHHHSLFEALTLQGIRVEAIRPGHILCSFTVPARLTSAATTSSAHCLAPGAAVALVDEIGFAAAVADGRHLKVVSVDMSVSLVDLGAAAAGDTLRIAARALGHKGFYSSTHVLISNAATGQVVAEGRHSLFGKPMKQQDDAASTATPIIVIKSNI